MYRTAPSLVFDAPGGQRLEAGGFQPLEAYDVCVANLDPTLERRGAPSGAQELLDAFPHGITTREVAVCLVEGNEPPDDTRAEDLMLELAAAGGAVAEPLGDSTLWTPFPPVATPAPARDTARFDRASLN